MLYSSQGFMFSAPRTLRVLQPAYRAFCTPGFVGSAPRGLCRFSTPGFVRSAPRDLCDLAPRGLRFVHPGVGVFCTLRIVCSAP